MTHNEKSTRYYSGRQERKVAKAVGGRQVVNSGAPTFVAGDVVTQDFLIECKTKTTDCKSFTIKEDWLLKSAEEAFAMGRDSALCFDFGPSANKRYYIISERMFEVLQSLLRGEE